MNNLQGFQQFDYNNLKKPWFKRPFIYLPLIIIVLASVGYIGLNYKLVKVFTFGRSNHDLISKEAAEKYPMPKPEDERFDVLILGIRGENDLENGGLLTDSIEVLSIDKITQKASLIAIPRDLYIDMGGVRGKINEAYVVGLEKNQGIALVSEIISRMTGVYIDKTVVLDFKAFQEIVDNLGGIDIHLTKEFKETTQWGYEFSLQIGDNHLNGEQALYYVRSRYSTNDFDRARRQQEVMFAIKKKATSLGVLANPIKITDLYSSLKRNIKTDFQVWDISSLINVANVFSNSKSLKTYVISTENLVVEAHGTKNEYILLPKDEKFEEIKDFFMDILVDSQPVKK